VAARFLENLLAPGLSVTAGLEEVPPVNSSWQCHCDNADEIQIHHLLNVSPEHYWYASWLDFS